MSVPLHDLLSPGEEDVPSDDPRPELAEEFTRLEGEDPNWSAAWQEFEDSLDDRDWPYESSTPPSDGIDPTNL